MSLHALRHRKTATSIAIFLVAMFSFALYTTWIDSVPASNNYSDDNPQPIPPAEINLTDLPIIGDVIYWVLNKIADDNSNSNSSSNNECDCGCANGSSCTC